MSVSISCSKATNEFQYTGVSFALLLFRLSLLEVFAEVKNANENII